MGWITYSPVNENLRMFAADGGSSMRVNFTTFAVDLETIEEARFVIKNFDDEIVLQILYSEDAGRWTGLGTAGESASVTLYPDETDGLNNGTYRYFIRQEMSSGDIIVCQYGSFIVDKLGSTSPEAVTSLTELKFSVWGLFIERLFTDVTYVEDTFQIESANVLWPDGESGVLTITTYDDFQELSEYSCTYNGTYNVIFVDTRDTNGRFVSRSITVEAL